MKKRVLGFILAVLLIAPAIITLAGCSGGGKVKIYIDGGGQQGAYNSTASMDYDENANPYPYNTLEKLADEYNKSHPDVEIIINRNSLNNDREKLVSQLSQQKAPDILFYLPAGISEDMNKGWFVDLDSYYDKPNPYVTAGQAGNEKWRNIYNEDELEGFYAPNGMIFSAPIDKAPIGIIYNKELFKAAGITDTPEYYSEFIVAQDKLQTYFTSIGKNNNQATPPEDAMTPYFPLYYWYDIVLESSIYSNKLNTIDVLNKNGRADAEEVLRASEKPTGNPDFWLYNTTDKVYSAEYQAYINAVLELSKYYPKGYEGYYAESEFLKGRIGMVEANSGQMMKINKDKQRDFEVGTFPYPKLDKSITINGVTYECNPGEYYTRRGLAGLTTGWSVTNSAIKKGDAAVSAAVDFLMYLTAPTNNDKMVNDLGFSVPLSGNSTNQLYAGLIEDYSVDQQNEKATTWGAFNSWGSLGKSYMDTYLNNRKSLIGKRFTAADFTTNRNNYVDEMILELAKGFENAKLKIMRENNFDKTKW